MYHAEKAWFFYCPYYITLLCKIAAQINALLAPLKQGAKPQAYGL